MTTMKPRRLLCRAWEVRAYLSGAKTQFRVPIKPQPPHYQRDVEFPAIEVVSSNPLVRRERHDACRFWQFAGDATNRSEIVKCPFGTVGSRLWVAESFLLLRSGHYHDVGPRDRLLNHCGRIVVNGVEYKADDNGSEETLRCRKELGYDRYSSAATMPQWASRLTLEVKSVRVQRLQDISKEDAIAEGVAMLATLKKSGFKVGAFFGVEGVTDTDWLDPRDAYEQLWDSTHGPGSWESNPWVFAGEVSVVSA